MFESTDIIATRQYDMSYSLLNKANQTEVEGPVGAIHQWIDMTNQQVTLEDGTTAKTCKPAMGYSFAAGTTDGPGAFDFTQGSNQSNVFWDFVVGIIQEPTPEQVVCHAPKPILLDTGDINWPYAWHPRIIDTQMLKVGQFVIAALPGEFTTMSGRRMRKSVSESLARASNASTEFKVVLAGLSNVYTHYIATFEEYQRQRYEAASTIFGPHTLQAYQQQYAMLAEKLVKGDAVNGGVPPEDLSSKQLSFVTGVVYDNPPMGKSFGDCILQPPTQPVAIGDTVTVKFVSGHLRNDLMLESSYLYVEKQVNERTWETVASDASWETKLHWHRTNFLLGESEVTIEWTVPADAESGNYRIMHQGVSRNMIQKTPYAGFSRNFTVDASIDDGSHASSSGGSFKELLADFVADQLKHLFHSVHPKH